MPYDTPQCRRVALPMLFAVLVAILMVLVITLVHYEVLRDLSVLLPRLPTVAALMRAF